ncbi:YkgJ family cysteine cluster protein [Natrialba sp. INN-245]|uniref:YkgJ family cysteine cluster protein n=1 Tax=Natrialba sp. INN-245 TaxID=2690967 RepID=UPI0013105C71|nr:YkgJ family cysteine cluster protein [Natrialba sp. INN-245]MWV41722.1 YkgJ family cysteine cluster protein [Natrialba sp. INN-245]
MEVNCEGCAGCCLDWRGLLEDRTYDRARGSIRDGDGNRDPIDDDPNFVALTRETVRTYLDQGVADALTPRFWDARDEREGVEIDGRQVAAVAGRPVFFVGLRKPPKPVAPFGREEPSWLPTCVFLDPTTLQCRVHGGALFPQECGAYPAHTLTLKATAECERVEETFGGDRLLDASVREDLDGLLLGDAAIGEKLFCHPRPAALEGTIERLASGTTTAEDRAETIAVAAASSPGTIAISDHHYERARERALETVNGGSPGEDDRDSRRESWIGPAIDEWQQRRANADEPVPSPRVAADVEVGRGAPETPGWDALDDE